MRTTGGALAIMAIGAVLASACGGGSPAANAAAHSEYEGQPEYDRGLSMTLEDAPSSYAAAQLTKTYDLGYATGLLEASEDEFRQDDSNKQLGCMGIAPLLLSMRPQAFAGTAPCDAMVRPKYLGAKITGPEFAKGRLVVARAGAESGDPVITKMLLNAYENGYAMGFQHIEKPEEAPDRIRAAVRAGCIAVAAEENKREPFSDAEQQAIVQKCDSNAASVADTFVREMANRRR